MKMKEKPKYGMCSCIKFMIKTAWENIPSVLWLCIVFALTKVGGNLAQLFIAPTILKKVENLSSLGELLGTIGIFFVILLALDGLRGYVNQNILYGRVDLRGVILSKINHKAYNTSYPNTKDPEILRLYAKALNHCNSNEEASEHIWHTFTELLINIMGFVVYLFLIADVNAFLVCLVVVTTFAEFFVNRYINGWEYRHQDERKKYNKELNYIIAKAESVKLAKDIRIFGLAPWLKEIYDQVRKLTENFICRRERVYTWTCVLDVLLLLARNGIAYFYLISRTLQEGWSASEFLLYFTAFSGFSAWITGILTEFTQLHKECLDLSVILEYLNIPEQFRFSGGVPIPKAESYELKMENVSFHYPNTKKDIIRHMNLTVHPGEKVAVVGLNGAGKTTLIKLLCGFYDPCEGRVLLNGVDIRDFNRQEYYDLFSAVFQEMSMLDLTVEEHVAQRVEGIDREKVRECLDKAGLFNRVRTKNYCLRKRENTTNFGVLRRSIIKTPKIL